VVMKYIENPLLFPVNQELFKFDIRQWVLVTSIDPLEIYVFNSFYGRLCSFPYKLDDFSNTGIHLSNFSLNKQFFQK
jgi:Tubulin-tyrosine ligase family